MQGPAQEETLPVSPKPTQELPTNQVPSQIDINAANTALSSVIELKARMKKPDASNTASLMRKSSDLVTVRAKPEKRKNAKERAKERNDERNKDRTESVEVAAVVPEISGLSHPKPEKRLNAKERAKAKFAKKDDKKDTKKDAKGRAADGTTPMTAKAKSKGDTKAKMTKAAEAA